MECVTQMITKCKKKIIIHTNSKICIYYLEFSIGYGGWICRVLHAESQIGEK